MTSRLARNALAALQRGSWSEAEAICSDILRRNPRDAHALLVLGNVRAYSGDTVAAEPLFERARAAAPKDVVILNSLGGAYGANGKLHEARAALEEAVAIDGGFPWAQQNLGNVLSELGERGAAKRHYEQALRSKPDYADAMAGLADLAEKDHQLDEAERLARRALALAPLLVPACIVLSRVALRRGDYDGALARLDRLAESKTIRPTNRAMVWSLRGQAYEKLGRYDEAFSAFASANETRKAIHGERFADDGGAMSLSMVARLTAFIGTTDVESWSAAAVDGDSDPVFFVGFPRSGTTLLDQVLASHPDIETVEEQEGLTDALQPLMLADGAMSRWHAMGAEEIGGFRRAYWRRAEQALGAKRTRRVFIDKMPLYTVLLPLIYRLFPRARILFAVRDPRDVAISCFQQDFAMNAAMSQFLSLDKTVRYYDAVMRLGQLSRERLPLSVHVVKYEDVVRDFDRTIASTLEFLGLPWDGAVRDYAQTAKRRALRTPSAPQVIQPIYSSSIGRWRHYRTQMEPFLAALDPWVRSFGYSGD